MRGPLRAMLVAAAVIPLAALGCSRLRPIAPFGSVRTYSETVVPGPAGHPRGRMVMPQAPGIDLVKRPDLAEPTPMGPSSLDPSARAAGTSTP